MKKQLTKLIIFIIIITNSSIVYGQQLTPERIKYQNKSGIFFTDDQEKILLEKLIQGDSYLVQLNLLNKLYLEQKNVINELQLNYSELSREFIYLENEKIKLDNKLKKIEEEIKKEKRKKRNWIKVAIAEGIVIIGGIIILL